MAKTLGGWAFLIGVVLALLFAFWTYPGTAWLLVILGLVIGFLNITEKETSKFLMAGLTLVIVGNFAGNTLSSVAYLTNIFDNMVALFAPATVIVALKSAFELAKTK